MSKRIGEILVGRGFIQPEQLAKALQTQLTVGGHLGTCLIEMGLIAEEELARVLAETFDTPHAAGEMFDSIPRSVIECLSRDMVEKHRAIPIERDGGTLAVAMIHPNDFIAVQEISFSTGCRVDPWVCPEARIYQAMERYYGIQRPRRYIPLSAYLESPAARPQRSGGPPPAGGGGPAGFGGRRGPREPGPAGSARRAPAVALASAPRPAAGVATATLEPEAQSPPFPESMPAAATGATEQTPAALEQLTELMLRADTENDVAEAVTSYISREGAHCILFRVVDDVAVPWQFAGRGLEDEAIRELELPLREFTLFHLLLEEPYYCGPAMQDDETARFFERIGIERPAEIALIPVFHRGHMESLLYADSGNWFSLPEEIDVYRRIARRAYLARVMTRIKQQIRSA